MDPDPDPGMQIHGTDYVVIVCRKTYMKGKDLFPSRLSMRRAWLRWWRSRVEVEYSRASGESVASWYPLFVPLPGKI